MNGRYLTIIIGPLNSEGRQVSMGGPDRLEKEAMVRADQAGARLDQAAAELLPEFSRARLQHWIKSGELTMDGVSARPRTVVHGGEVLRLKAMVEADRRWEPQAIALDIVHEDEDILVIDKPAGLVVHPAAGHGDGTLLNALLHHCPELAALPRGGIVHRLDKDTTGLMVVARTLAAQASLVRQLQARTVSRYYEAVVRGVMTAGGTVDAPIGRHPANRLKMAVRQVGGKPAVTHYRVLRRYAHYSYIGVQLETGRTHQIRVHMAHIHYPLLGDPLYGTGYAPALASQDATAVVRGFARQALHARRLSLAHPGSGETMSWHSELPADFAALLAALESDDDGT